jgi:hypothetical protein
LIRRLKINTDFHLQESSPGESSHRKKLPPESSTAKRSHRKDGVEGPRQKPRPGRGQQKSVAKINGSRRTENRVAGSNEDQPWVQADDTCVDLSRQLKLWRSPWKLQVRANQTMASLQEKTGWCRGQHPTQEGTDLHRQMNYAEERT